MEPIFNGASFTRGMDTSLSARDISDTVNALSNTQLHQLPSIEDPAASWHVALCSALISAFQMSLRDGPRSTLGGSLSLQMIWPLKKHAFISRVAIDSSMIYSPSGDRESDKQRLLRTRYIIAKELIDRASDDLAQWVDIAKNGTKYTVKDILRIRNIEQRMAALKIMGADRLLQESHATLISKSKRGNELYVIPKNSGIFDSDAYYLKYSCVSTGRVYVSGVPVELFDVQGAVSARVAAQNRALNNGEFARFRGVALEPMYAQNYPVTAWADLAMAWKFRLSYEDYTKLTKENEG